MPDYRFAASLGIKVHKLTKKEISRINNWYWQPRARYVITAPDGLEYYSYEASREEIEDIALRRWGCHEYPEPSPV